jgi:hypothetical protein
MMQLTDKEKAIFENIKIYDRYVALSNTYSFEKMFDSYSNDEVLKIIKHLGYKAKYVKSDNFFKVTDKVKPFDFKLHLILKYGLVEVVLTAKNEDAKEVTGDVFAMICKLVERSRGVERDGYVGKPRFRDYDDLREILREILSIYDDFRQEVIKQNE